MYCTTKLVPFMTAIVLFFHRILNKILNNTKILKGSPLLFYGLGNSVGGNVVPGKEMVCFVAV